MGKLWAVFVVSILLAAAPAEATGRLAHRTGKSCLACHRDNRGNLGLNRTGEKYARNGLRAALDPSLTVPGEGSPLTPGGARMLHRRTQDLGRRLFEMRDLGRTRASCASCHAGGKDLAQGVWETYPRYRTDLGRWSTLEGAINHCMVTKVGSEPIASGTVSSVGLQLMVRRLAGSPPRYEADDKAWVEASR